MEVTGLKVNKNDISPALVQFIKDSGHLIEDNQYAELYQKLLTVSEINEYNDVGTLTAILYAAGIDPLQFMHYIPDNFLAGSDIEAIKIPSDISAIGLCAFARCTSLAQVTFSPGLLSIEERAFQGCRSLRSVKLPESLHVIDYATFSGCAELREVFIDDQVAFIGSDAFKGCLVLRDIFYGGTVDQWKRVKIITPNWDLQACTIHCTDGDVEP